MGKRPLLLTLEYLSVGSTINILGEVTVHADRRRGTQDIGTEFC